MLVISFDLILIIIFFSRTAYGRAIEDTEQPLLLHRPKKRRLPRGRGRGQGGGVEQTEEVFYLQIVLRYIFMFIV